MTQWTFTRCEPGSIRNMASWHLSRPNHEPYQIDISWPLGWSLQENHVANLLYLVDGNAMILTATEALRRRQSTRPQETGTVVVGIGYPLTDTVFSPRRSFDLTPPSANYTPPERPDGTPKDESHGGANEFLAFITDILEPFITMKVFPKVSFAKRALFGHSYGGLFVLHALFTRPDRFDVYLAASPSIWWNDRFILSEAAQFRDNNSQSLPVLRPSFWLEGTVPRSRAGRIPREVRAKEKRCAES